MILYSSLKQAGVINRALRWYERSTGQLINPTKCSMMAGSNCKQQEKEKVMEILNVASTTMGKNI
jgi:hypothetical protein